jgi:hypothetical protein
MRRLVPGLALLLVALTFVSLGVATSAWAHSEHAAALSTAGDARHGDLASVTTGDVAALTLSAAPDVPAFPWPLLVAALIAVALGWRRPRRAIALAIVLLLAVLCFEDGLHSVHHLTGQAKPVRCAIATATAHLTATAVDSVATTDIVLPVVPVAIEIAQTDPVARFLCPDQGRAPPSPTA